MFIHARSLTEQVVGGIGRHLDSKELGRMLEEIRSRPVLPAEDLEKLKAYAKRHMGDLETVEKLNNFPQDRNLRQAEKEKLETILRLLQRHTLLTDAKLFLSGREIRQAANLGLNEAAINHIMRSINKIESVKEVEAYAASMQTKHNFSFPVARYTVARFSLQD